VKAMPKPKPELGILLGACKNCTTSQGNLYTPPEFLHPHSPGNENVAVWPSGQKLLVGCVIKAVHPFNPWPQKREN